MPTSLFCRLLDPAAAIPRCELTEALPGQPLFCQVISHFLSAAECRALIAASEARGFAGADTDYPPSYRNNARQVVDDADLAQRLMQRLRAFAPATLQGDGVQWRLAGINPRWRFCRYQPGQHFALHQDGVHHHTRTVQSRLTFMIYLTDGAAFDGGDTVFYSAGPGGDATGQPAREIGRVRPRAGSLIVFDHALWHAGAPVSAGVKHIMRSDVLYQRADDVAPDDGVLNRHAQPFQPGHKGYVWALAALGDQIASGGRDGVIRIWTSSGRPLRQLAGHVQSVLGLAWLPDGKLVSVSRDRSMRWWDAASGRCLHTVQVHQAAVLSVAALPGGRIATSGADGLLKRWDGAGQLLGSSTAHAGWAWVVQALPDGGLASAGEDGSIRLWNDDGCLRAAITGTQPLQALAVSACGQYLCSGSTAGQITVWQAGAGGWRQRAQWSAHSAAIRRLRWLDAATLVSTGEDNCVCVWAMPGQQLQYCARHGNFATDAISLADGSLLSCGYDGQIRRHEWRRPPGANALLHQDLAVTA
ncbi:hypothetical protein IGB42_04216 [Andreprevotia sp. IGB-42]|uniref:2OG-Fe(II) oxygenase n=1 Tax=Andreprevotia sp. IGB-42 TaxID=2497473 RepID=UPI00135AEF8D|nr:2OG-Fe(II) oxygenase [Andreprevotia sp. IGB-42]KAF0811321.1 hypothetical protein IGB42_04216 [Andreprevotia sp. IGB-42]